MTKERVFFRLTHTSEYRGFTESRTYDAGTLVELLEATELSGIGCYLVRFPDGDTHRLLPGEFVEVSALERIAAQAE